MSKNIQRLLVGGLFCLAASLAPCVARAENSLSVGRGTANSGNVADIPLLLSGDEYVQGFVLVFEWDAGKARGVDVLPNDGAGKPLNSADLVTSRVEDGFMILAVVMDADGKDAEKIPAGQGTEVGTAKIRCVGPDSGSREVPLRLVDGKYARVDGGPLLSNIISIGGRSIGEAEGLRKHDGALVCEGEAPPPGNLMFACGGPLGNDGLPTELAGPRSSRQTVNFYYKSPNDKIQGLSMAVSYSCDLTAVEESFSEEGGVLKEVNAEFVHIEIDNINKTVDKDDCAFTLGVLVDATSPFDGRTLPTTSSFRKLFSIDIEIEDDATCNKCYWIKFMNGISANQEPPVKNLVSINFQSQSPQLMNCKICVQGGKPKFIRGDCNFSNMGAMSVDISDAAAMVGYFFLTGDKKFNAPCDDACDANDDGRLDAADVVFILNYMFVSGSPKPPKPGPTSAGVDPTDDSLGCKGGTATCD